MSDHDRTHVLLCTRVRRVFGPNVRMALAVILFCLLWWGWNAVGH